MLAPRERGITKRGERELLLLQLLAAGWGEDEWSNLRKDNIEDNAVQNIVILPLIQDVLFQAWTK
jgi:hypothetical protein